MGRVVKLEQPEDQRLVLDRKEVLAAIPTNWLDDLLTGRGRLPKGYTYTGPDIERLLNGIRARIEAIRTMESCDCCKAIVWSDQDACSNCG